MKERPHLDRIFVFSYIRSPGEGLIGQPPTEREKHMYIFFSARLGRGVRGGHVATQVTHTARSTMSKKLPDLHEAVPALLTQKPEVSARM